MKIFLIIMASHFMAGFCGILLINRNLNKELRKLNLIKYFVYLLIFLVVISSILIKRNLFLACTIIIFSAGLFELQSLAKKTGFNPGFRFSMISASVYAIICFLFSLFVITEKEIIVFVYTLVIIFDGASQITGQLSGRHKIMAVISPSKTLEGLIGGLGITVTTSWLLHGFAGFEPAVAIMLGFLICCASFAGDALSSFYKRAHKAKDFSNFIPGHGGFLDRFDSFLLAGAMIGLLGLTGFVPLPGTYNNILFYLGFSISYIMVLFSGEVSGYLFGLKPEYSRMITHVLAGMISLLLSGLLTSVWYIAAICIQSALFLFMTKKMDIFNSHHKVSRNTYGSSWFFIGVLIAYLSSISLNNKGLFYIPLLILTISDPLASLTGLKLKPAMPGWLQFENSFGKTIFGSAGFFISTNAILLAAIPVFYSLPFPKLVIISVTLSTVLTITEAISPSGSDNVTIPVIGVAGMLLI